MTKTPKLIKSGLILSFGLALGRLSGFFREVVLAQTVGVSVEADITVMVLTFPDFFMALFVSGAIAHILIPEFHELKPSQFRPYLLLIFKRAFPFFAGTLLLLYVFTSWLASWLGPGLPVSQQTVAAQALSWVILALPIFLMAAITRAFLQSQHRFTWLGLENLIYNTVIIFGLIYFYTDQNFIGLATIIAIGAAIKVFPQAYVIFTRLTPAKTQPAPPLGSGLARRYFEAIATGAMLVALPYFARSLISLEGLGLLSAFNYGMKVVELPMALGVGSLATVIFPKLSEHVQKGTDKDHDLFRNGIKAIAAVSVPLVGMLGWYLWDYREPSFGLAKIEPQQLSWIVKMTLIGLLSLPARGIWVLVVVKMNAHKDTYRPLIVSLATLAVAYPAMEGGRQLAGYEGIIWGLVGTYWFAMILGLIILEWSYGIRVVRSLFARPVITSVSATLFLVVGLAQFSSLLDVDSEAMKALLRLVSAMLGGVVVLGLVYYQLGSFKFSLSAKANT